jgi:predicted anti-sigma-YlaC factor YlaD
MISCNVARDLLPGYIDGMLEPHTAAELEQHLAGCDECHAIFRGMNTQVNMETFRSSDDKEAVNYLETIRRKTRNRVLIAVAVAIAAFFAILILGGMFLLHYAPDSIAAYYIRDAIQTLRDSG